MCERELDLFVTNNYCRVEREREKPIQTNEFQYDTRNNSNNNDKHSCAYLRYDVGTIYLYLYTRARRY